MAKHRSERSLPEEAELILRILWNSRITTVKQLVALTGMPQHKVSSLLTEISNDWNLIRSLRERRPGGSNVWFLTEKGGQTVRAVCDAAGEVPTPEQVAGALQAHALAVNDACSAFVAGARDTEDECGPLAWKLEEEIQWRQGRGRDSVMRADALLHYIRIDDDPGASFSIRPRMYAVELDRGTEPTAELAAKVRRYALARSFVSDPKKNPQPDWTQRWPAFPRVLIVLAGRGDDGPRQLERRLQMALQISLADPIVRRDAGQLHVSLCRLDQLMEQGPHADVFWPLDPQIDPTQLRPTSMAGLDQRRDPPAPAPAETPAAGDGRPTLLDAELDGGEQQYA